MYITNSNCNPCKLQERPRSNRLPRVTGSGENEFEALRFVEKFVDRFENVTRQANIDPRPRVQWRQTARNGLSHIRAFCDRPTLFSPPHPPSVPLLLTHPVHAWRARRWIHTCASQRSAGNSDHLLWVCGCACACACVCVRVRHHCRGTGMWMDSELEPEDREDGSDVQRGSQSFSAPG